jgi:hypothetical protein
VNSADAKGILMACRPGTDDLREPAARAALEQVERDPELRAWWEEQQAFQQQMRERFRNAPVPGHLQERILSRAKIVRLPWWRQPIALSAAAAVIFLAAVTAVWHKQPEENTFPVFRERMASSVQRQYAMTIRTNDMAAIRRHLAATNAPADYALPGNLSRLPALGAGVLGWQDRRVSMVCLDSGGQGIVFLFVVDAASLKHPPQRREYANVKSLATVSWTEKGKTYVLAGNGTDDWIRTLP